ncbi:MAG: putative Ig domain-containing protein, partial [Candidatus Kerfeldbacteria bacterium]|nr:putative Ig domain-containing protein [Candidatus Kerfeldbacteria bacterium]
YEAIRDGRTVYVNVANIGKDNKLYTNVYLISYNEGAGPDTVNIFNQLLSNWRFNSNLIEEGRCSPTTEQVCLIDRDCPAEEYCVANKAKIQRDTKRLADLSDINFTLEEYKQTQGMYPSLSAGTYLSGKSISVWPSWQATLGNFLKKALPVDPVNKLGSCKGFDANTCWNEQTKKFAGNIPDILPQDSNVYVYSAADGGGDYVLCGIFEAGYVSYAEGACPGTAGAPIGGVEGNNPPQIISTPVSCAGAGDTYFYKVEARDPENQYLTYSLSGGPAGININKLTGEIYGTPSPVGRYNVEVKVQDVYGASAKQNYELSVTNLDYEITVKHQPGNIILLGSAYAGQIQTNAAGTVKYQLFGAPYWLKIDESTGKMQGKPNSTDDLGIVTIMAVATADQTECSGVFAMKNFQLEVYNTPPVITSTFPKEVIAAYEYTYQITAKDIDGQTLIYSLTQAPAWLKIDSKTGVVSGVPDQLGNYDIEVAVSDGYESDTQDFTLRVTNRAPVITKAPSTSYVVTDDVFSFDVGAYDPDGDKHILNYSLSGNPSWLLIDSATGKISGLPSNDAADTGTYNITLIVKDQFGGQASAAFKLISQPLYNSQYDWNLGSKANTVYNDATGQLRINTAQIKTPYLWVANSGDNTVVRIDTQNYSRVGPFGVGVNPSRTAVDINDNVWVANRNSGNITKLNREGVHLKTCPTGGGPRGVAIDGQGNVWVANNSNNNVVKISGDDTSCDILAAVDVQGGPYGAAVDGSGHVWIVNRGAGSVSKIDITNNTVQHFGGVSGPYGIGIDQQDNVWVASWEGQSIYKINGQTGGIIFNKPLGMNARGVAVDAYGNVWVSHSYNDKVTKLDTNGNILFTAPSDPNSVSGYVGAHPIGITATAEGFIWVV